jgi:hypothetical protein
MNLTDVKPLKPLTHGSILIVGGKASNFDDEIKTHPRIIMWESQNEHWSDKDVPHNVQAIFVTRFIGHVAFGKILAEARKKRITIFNPEGTGMIVRQVRELLGLTKSVTTEETRVTMVPTTPATVKVKSKLKALVPFIDFNKTNIDNGKTLLVKAQELGITSTLASLSNFVGVQRKGARKAPVTRTVKAKLDVSVEILDNVIKELQDMRDYVVAVTKENEALKTRIEKFKKALDND